MDSPRRKQTVCKVLNRFQHGKYLVAYVLKDTYFVIYGIISEFTDKGNFTSLPGQFQYLTLLRGLQGGLTCKFDQALSTAKNLSIGYYFA